MALLRRIFTLGRRSSHDREVEAELREHMRMCIDDQVANGMSRKEAKRHARLMLGNPTAMRERVTAEDTALGLDSLLRDVRYALRGFRKSPGFALVAILTLALGIGANTAVFELLDAVRLRSLPIHNPAELSELQIKGGNDGMGLNEGPYSKFTIPMWQEIRRHHDPFSGVFAWRTSEATLGRHNEGRHVSALEVSGEFFNVLGVVPWRGRLIEPQDEASCEVSKVVASYAFWKSQMGSIPITPNTSIYVEGRLVQVLGVTPPAFFGLIVGDRFELAYPTCTPSNPRRDDFMMSVMGRLKPDWNIGRASAYLDALSPGLFDSTAPTGYSSAAINRYKSFRLEAVEAGSGVSTLRKAYDASLRLLLAITGLVLLIACANLANLMLARASVRQRAVAIRIALGASRGRLLQQMFIESGLLALCGALLGIAIAQPLSRLLVASMSTERDTIQVAISTDWRVLLFAATVAAVTCVIFGTFPAMRSAKVDPISAIRSGERGVTGNRERFSIQRLMVVMQMAISMVLLMAALLFVRSYRNLATLDPGVRESGMTVGFFDFSTLNIKPENRAAFTRQLVDDVRAIPGVQNAGATTHVLLNGGSWSHSVHVGSIEGSSRFTYVSPSYLATVGIPILRGRGFTKEDTVNSPFVLIVNQAFIRKFLGGGPALGQLIHVMPEPDYPERHYLIVGTIPDTKYNDLRADAEPMAFVPIDQLPVEAQRPGAAIMIASNDSTAAIDAIRHTIGVRYPLISLNFADFEQGIRDNLVGDRMMAMLAGFFGILAALLVVVGLYGVLSYFLAQRRNEIGIRIALGARRGQVIGLVLRDTAGMLAAGLGLGILLTLGVGRAASAMLFGLKAWDPATMSLAVLLLAAVSFVASWIPARKAANLDPVAALRTE
ncbi:MAG TPA: ABC transporter permease [Acidobacteriaceae bacterium]|jgi:predicted permease|nr:ABC transporter permease [Acidobacteriaceae bacterium]